MTDKHASILIVEDEPQQRQLVAEILRAEGFQVCEAKSHQAAICALKQQTFNLVISDLNLGDGDGLKLLFEASRQQPQAGTILVTAYGSIEHAVGAIHAGIDDYLSKPFQRQSLLLAVDKVIKHRCLAAENQRLNDALEERDRLVDLVGRAPKMQRLYRQIEKIAATEVTVLLSGESGTGKELAARALHKLSQRNSGPFIAINCAAIPEGLMEAEFFGAEKGAYTGSSSSRQGRFEAAAGGSLFLDELGELPLQIQPKLLRALQENKITRVGSNNEISTDVRVIAASNRDLKAEVAAGRFREDLYYRLNVVPLQLPPLRERIEDIPKLIEHFRSRTQRVHGVDSPELSKPLLRQLMNHPWPGNVRELGNVVERLILLADHNGPNTEDLPSDFHSDMTTLSDAFKLPPQGVSWPEIEKSALSQALELAQNNRSKAAKLLGLPYKAFLYRLEKHAL